MSKKGFIKTVMTFPQNNDVATGEIERAYLSWRFLAGLEASDSQISPFLHLPNQRPSDGYLCSARKALGISSDVAAQRLGVTRKALLDFEAREVQGTLQMKSLEKCAEAIGCELIYAVRPKSRKSFSREIWDRLLPDVLASGRMRSVDPKRRVLRLISAFEYLLEDPEFRRRHQISERFREMRATRRL